MAVKEVGRFVNTIEWRSDNSWQREMQRIKKYKRTVESAHEQIARSQYRASAGMIKAEQAQARAREKVRKAAIAAQMRSQKQLQALETRMAKEQARKNKMLSGVVSGRSMAKQRTLTTMSGMRNMFSAATMDKYRASLQSLNAQYAAGGMSVSMYNQKLAALRNEMRATEASALKLSSALKLGMSGVKDLGKFAGSVIDAGFNAAMVGTVAAGGLTKMAMDNAANRHSAYYGLMAMNNDDKAATDDQMRFIRNVSNAHGMDQKTTETGYMQWAASTKMMTENDRRALFEAMAIKGRSTGATSEQLQRAQVALSQMAGKGQVMAEELKGQLAEALAGAQVDFQAAYAKSVGKETVTLEEFNKAMKDGDVKLQKLLPHLVEIWNSAKNTRAYAESMKQPEMAMQRLKNAAYEASMAMFGQIDATDGVYTLAELVNDTASSLTDTLNENKDAIESFGAGLAAFFDQLMYLAGQAWQILKSYVLEPMGVDTEDPAAVGKALAEAVKYIIGLKAIKSVVGLFAPLVSGIWKLGGALKGLFGVINIGLGSLLKGPLGAAIAGGMAADWAWDNVIMPANDAMYGDETTAGGNLKKDSPLGKMWDSLAGWWQHGKESGKFPSWYPGVNNTASVPPGIPTPTTPIVPTTPTINTQALPAPATGFNGVVPTQVMVESSGDINTKFELTVDENGLLRVVQKEVETAISWEKTKEINMFASPSY